MKRRIKIKEGKEGLRKSDEKIWGKINRDERKQKREKSHWDEEEGRNKR